VAVLVLRHLADEFPAVGSQAGDSGVDVVDGEHDAAEAQRVPQRVRRLRADRRRGEELRQLEPAVSVWSSHHRDLDMDVIEPIDTVDPRSLDRRLALHLHAEFEKEGSSGLQVVDDDAHVVHSLNRHGGSPASRGLWWPPLTVERSRRHTLDTRRHAES
jgi:hypothetical protein